MIDVSALMSVVQPAARAADNAGPDNGFDFASTLDLMAGNEQGLAAASDAAPVADVISTDLLVGAMPGPEAQSFAALTQALAPAAAPAPQSAISQKLPGGAEISAANDVDMESAPAAMPSSAEIADLLPVQQAGETDASDPERASAPASEQDESVEAKKTGSEATQGSKDAAAHIAVAPALVAIPAKIQAPAQQLQAEPQKKLAPSTVVDKVAVSAGKRTRGDVEGSEVPLDEQRTEGPDVTAPVLNVDQTIAAIPGGVRAISAQPQSQSQSQSQTQTQTQTHQSSRMQSKSPTLPASERGAQVDLSPTAGVPAETGEGAAEARAAIATLVDAANKAVMAVADGQPSAGNSQTVPMSMSVQAGVFGHRTPEGMSGAVGDPAQPGLAAPAANPTGVVSAKAGHMGREMGVEIARRIKEGKQEIMLRLDPAEMGRVEVRMSFDGDGRLRAVVSADNPAALDILRRDAGDLIRSLSDSGLRTDAQSFKFDARGGEQGQQPWHRQQAAGSGHRAKSDASAFPTVEDEPVYRRLRESGRVDMMA